MLAPPILDGFFRRRGRGAGRVAVSSGRQETLFVSCASRFCFRGGVGVRANTVCGMCAATVVVFVSMAVFG